MNDTADQRVRSFPFNSEGTDIVELAQDIVECAADDASGGMSTVETYCVVSYEKGNRAQWKERSARFRIDTGRLDSAEKEDIVNANVEPSLKNHWGQILRHNESLYRATLGRQEQRDEMRERMLETMLNKLDRAYQDRFEMLEKVHDLLSAAHEAELETRREERKEQLVSEAIGSLKLLAPAILKRAGVAEAVALPGESPSMALVKELMGSLNEQQLNAILGTLTPQQQIAFAELATALQEHEQEQDEKAERVKGKTNDAN